MSINKQLYFGIFGICGLFGGLCVILILLASIKLFNGYNLKIKALFNIMDTNIVSLNEENADLIAQLLFNQGKFESFLIRNYFNILKDEMGNNLFEIINIDSSEINSHFKFYTDTSTLCNEENSDCYFVYSDESIININDFTKKVLYFIKPIIKISLDTYAFDKDNFKIFNKFNFFDKESNSYISYKYDLNDIEKNFDQSIKASVLMNNIFLIFLSSIDFFQNVNKLDINDMIYEELFKENTYTLIPAFQQKLFLDPFYKSLSRTFHYGSFSFNKNEIDDNDKVDKSKINLNYLDNYLSFDMKVDYLSIFSLNFIERNGAVFLFIITNQFKYTASKSICRLMDFNNYTYSDESVNNPKIFTFESLGIDEFQLFDLKDCFINEKIIYMITSDIKYDFSLKILANTFKYSYEKDVNNQIISKLMRISSPNELSKTLINMKFYVTFQADFLVVKAFNNIMIINTLIDRLTYRSISYIILLTFFLWWVILLFVLIKLYLIADRISSPIRKLIKNISLSQGNFNNNGANLENIYYQEDKDINDLFQLCQRLIIGGFKKSNHIKNQNKLNVYNNISKVKSNNMIINENDIVIQRNHKYNEIFEKGNEIEKKEDNFKNDIYYTFKNKEFENKINNYESIKIKKVPNDRKDEIENLKNKDSEYKMFYFIHKEIENFLPFNNLYKCYYDEFYKKGNKKKKK